MRLFEFSTHLFEYKRDITINKLGDKLVARATSDRKQPIEEILDVLEKIDPTKNKQYTEWLATQYIKNQFRLEDYPRVADVLVKFENAKSRLQQKDINKYTFQSLENEMDKVYNTELASTTDREHTAKSDNTSTFPVVPDTEVLYNGPLGQLSIPKTEAASCELGRGTKWCTAAARNNQFDNYSSNSPLYVWRDKNGEKYQFYFGIGGDSVPQFMDSKDNPISPALLNQFRTTHPILSKLFKREESQIMKNLRAATDYATNVIHGRWPEAEPYIMKDAGWPSVYYAKNFIKGRWPEAEPYIMKDSRAALSYAKYVIKGRWPEAEPVIMKDAWAAAEYKSFIETLRQ